VVINDALLSEGACRTSRSHFNLMARNSEKSDNARCVTVM